MSPTDPRPRLITTKEAAELLSVSPRTVLNWIRDDAIPYVELPARGGQRHEYRIPMHGLLRSLAGNYDLAAEFRGADDVVADASSELEKTVSPRRHSGVISST